MYLTCHKINPNRGESFIDSPWTKDKKATINPINKNDNKCFQYAVTIALNHKKNRKNQERIKPFIDRNKIKPFVDGHNWEGINYPSGKDDWRNMRKII